MQQGGDLNTAYPEARTILANLQVHIESLESGIKDDEKGNYVLNEVEKVISSCQLFSSWVALENPARREMWRKRVVQLQEEAQAIKNVAMKHVKYIRRTQTEVEERQALLQRRHGQMPNNSAANDDVHLKVNSSLQRSSEMIDQYIHQSGAVLSSLGNQRDTLKNARKVILDIGTRLGLSQSLLSAVTRRESGDFWIVIIGILFLMIELL